MQIKKGGVISFRLPNDTTDEVLDYLNNLKSATGRMFSSRIHQIFLKGLANERELVKDDYIFLKIPRDISLAKRKWIQSKETQQYLISLFFQPPLFNKTETKDASDSVTYPDLQHNLPNKTETFIFDNFYDLDE